MSVLATVRKKLSKNPSWIVLSRDRDHSPSFPRKRESSGWGLNTRDGTQRFQTASKVCGAVVCAVLIGGCALIAAPTTSPEPSPKAAQLLAEGGYVEAHLMRRFAEGGLLVRLPDGVVWLLDPKEHCSWCWIYVGNPVWVKLGKRSATLLNSKGETAECWNGGPMSKY